MKRCVIFGGKSRKAAIKATSTCMSRQKISRNGSWTAKVCSFRERDRQMKRCVIFGGGQIGDPEQIKNLVRQEDYLICADSGYRHCVQLGFSPQLVLGDFDSYAGVVQSDCELLRYPIEKDDTDTMLAVKQALQRGYDSPQLVLGDFDSYAGVVQSDCELLRYPIEKDDTDTMLAVKQALQRGYDQLVLVGMLGGRLDHTLANIQTLVYAVEHGAAAQIIDSSCCITVIKGGQTAQIPYQQGFHFSVFCHSDCASGVCIRHAKYELIDSSCCITVIKGGQTAQIPYQQGFHFSVFCHSDCASGVCIRHAKYELEAAQITNGFPIGVSNSFLEGQPAQISVKQGILVILSTGGD